MTAGNRVRCRWHTDSPHGRCPNPQQFPGVQGAPPFCDLHLGELEPWVRSRAAQPGAEARDWIEWARRKAQDVQSVRRLLVGRAGMP